MVKNIQILIIRRSVVGQQTSLKLTENLFRKIPNPSSYFFTHLPFGRVSHTFCKRYGGFVQDVANSMGDL